MFFFRSAVSFPIERLDTSVHAVFLAFFRDEFPLMKVQRDTHHWLRPRNLESCVPGCRSLLTIVKVAACVPRRQFCANELAIRPFPRRINVDRDAITMAFRFSFIFTHSELSNSQRAVRLIFDASRDEVCAR